MPAWEDKKITMFSLLPSFSKQSRPRRIKQNSDPNAITHRARSMLCQSLAKSLFTYSTQHGTHNKSINVSKYESFPRTIMQCSPSVLPPAAASRYTWLSGTRNVASETKGRISCCN